MSASTPAPAAFGISAAQASRLDLSISSGLTPVFWIYFAFVLGLAVLCVAQACGGFERMRALDRRGAPPFAPRDASEPPAPFAATGPREELPVTASANPPSDAEDSLSNS